MSQPFETPDQVSIADQINAVKREIILREFGYQKKVAQRNMTQAMADREIACMKAVLETLRRVASGKLS